MEHRSMWLRRSSWTKVTMSLQTTGPWESWCMSCWLAGEARNTWPRSDSSCSESYSFCLFLQSSIHGSRPDENLQHHPERHRHDRVSQEDHKECCQPYQEALQVEVLQSRTSWFQLWVRILTVFTYLCLQRQSFRETGEPEERCEGHPEAQVSDLWVAHGTDFILIELKQRFLSSGGLKVLTGTGCGKELWLRPSHLR